MTKDETRLDLKGRARIYRRWGVLGVMCAAITVGCAPEPDKTGKTEPAKSSLLTPGRVDPIRVQAIFVSRDDESLTPTVTPEMVSQDLALASQIYAPANIRFEFDPKMDWTSKKSTLLSQHCTLDPQTVIGTPQGPPEGTPACHDDPNIPARDQLAQTYPGKLVVFYAADETAIKDDDGNWQFGQYSPNWSNGDNWFVLMLGGDTCRDPMTGLPQHPCEALAHEIGHYLHLPHTMGFVSQAQTSEGKLSDTRNAIVNYVETQGHAKEDAYQLFDGDGLTSTPPDPGPELFVASTLNPCNAADGRLDLTVNFSDGPFVYSFTPDRENVMDYWDKWCRGGTPDISIDQVLAVRAAIDVGNRAHLIDTRQLYSAVFEPGNTEETRAMGWAFSDFVTRFDQEITYGRHLVHMQAYASGGGLLWDGVWDSGSRGTTRALGWTLTDFATRFNDEIAAGKHLVHMQAYDVGGGQIRYDGVWEDGARGTTRAIGWALGDFATRFNDEIAAGKHLVHMQAYDVGGGQIRYDGAWEDGNLGTTRAIGWALSDFVTRFDQETTAGKHLVHMQAYDIGGGQMRWDGVWETGNNGTAFTIASAFNDFVALNKQHGDAGKRLVHFQPYDTGDGLMLYDGVWETSTTVQTHIFAESIYKFAEQFDKEVNAGRHAVQMWSVRAGQGLTTTELFLHNGNTGATQLWTMRGTTRISYADLDGYLNLSDSTGWRFIGARDFNKDGKLDILIHNVSSGAFEIWYMDGVTRTGYADFDSYLNLPDSTGWSVVGIADVDHDGTIDIVIHNGISGATQVWHMDGGSRISYADLDSSLNVADSSGWRPFGTGDFNQDGNVDLLWHNGTSGQTQVWYMNGVTRIGFANVDSRLDLPDSTGWTIISTADVNLDGRPDITIHNGGSGATQVWYMNQDGTARLSYPNFDSYLDLPDSTGWLFINSR